MRAKRIAEWLFFVGALALVLPRLPWNVTGLAGLAIVCFFLLPNSD